MKVKWLYVIFYAAIVLVCCVMSDLSAKDGKMILKVRWQRLVDENGRTCDRCKGTQEELAQAVQSLKASLRPLGIEVALEKGALSPEECMNDIGKSNRIWIAERPLEEWIGAEVGQSACSSCCSELGKDVECRTVSVNGEAYEVIPSELIVRAGLLAASRIMPIPSSDSCCPSADKSQTGDDGCCPRVNRHEDPNRKDPI